MPLSRLGLLCRRAAALCAVLAMTNLLSGPMPAGAATPAPLGARAHLGAWVAGMDADPTKLARLEQLTAHSIGIASVFRGAQEVFPSAADRALVASGRRLLVSWHLDIDRYSAWVAGTYDADIDRTARAVKAFGAPVYIRPWAEMNADWVTFQPTAAGTKLHGGTPAQFKAAWRRVVTRFRAAGATNARWVFNPTADTYAETTPVATIWPGASYVDVLGIDGYNWGTYGNLTWRSFSNIFSTQYQRLTALAPTLPVWICETGSADPASTAQRVRVTAPAGQTKATWWRDALANTSMPKITALVLFDANKERDWRVESSSAALLAVRRGLAAPR